MFGFATSILASAREAVSEGFFCFFTRAAITLTVLLVWMAVLGISVARLPRRIAVPAQPEVAVPRGTTHHWSHLHRGGAEDAEDAQRA